jgi:hypothetical protein
MSYQPKEGSGALFKNDKGDNPARPDYRGDVMVGGVVYELSAWIKPLPADASKKFMSISAKPKQARNGDSRAPSASRPPPRRPYDDDRERDPF